MEHSEKDKHKSLGSIAGLTIGQRFAITLQVTQMSIFFTDFIFERTFEHPWSCQNQLTLRRENQIFQAPKEEY